MIPSAEIERRDDPETVFVVPGHMNLTLAQMDIILRAGQQPGVPFRLGAAGAQRPQVNYMAMIPCQTCLQLRSDSSAVFRKRN